MSCSSVIANIFLSTGAIIGFQEVSYTTNENVTPLEVCAELLSGELGRDLFVTLSTADNSALGKREIPHLEYESRVNTLLVHRSLLPS